LIGYSFARMSTTPGTCLTIQRRALFCVQSSRGGETGYDCGGGDPAAACTISAGNCVLLQVPTHPRSENSSKHMNLPEFVAAVVRLSLAKYPPGKQDSWFNTETGSCANTLDSKLIELALHTWHAAGCRSRRLALRCITPAKAVERAYQADGLLLQRRRCDHRADGSKRDPCRVFRPPRQA
jgi:hypothetical protein